MTHSWKHRLLGLAALPLLALSACTTAPPADDSAGDTPIEIAFLNVSAANTYLAAANEAIQQIAEDENVNVTEFDAKFTPGVQAGQIQDVIAAGKYQGIILVALDGAALAPAVSDAIDAGLKVVLLNQIVGEDFGTADPQVDGVSGSVLAPPVVTGQRLGDLTVGACEDIDPCRVVYMYGLKGVLYDVAVREGFDQQVADHDNIEIVAEAEGGFLGTDEPFKATQDIISANPEFDVLAASGDQQARGAALALADAGLSDVKLIGVGGSKPAVDGIKDGSWYGSVALVPYVEGELAMRAIIDAVRDGKDTGGIDPVADQIDNGLLTADNVDEFTPQWAG